MENVVEVSSLKSLEALKLEATKQIANLLTQKQGLSNILTKVNTLIERYNAQKSYLGYASHWYGEQVWWMQIAVSIIAAGVAMILYIPTIISIALSLVTSFLLINHHHSTKERDRLISQDLESQNQAVKTMLTQLEATKRTLEGNIKSLCELHQKMCDQNIELRTTLSGVTAQAAEFKELSTKQSQQIKELQEKEQALYQQLEALQTEFSQYQKIVQESSEQFVQENQSFSETAANLRKTTESLSGVIGTVVSIAARSSNSLNASPTSSNTKAVIQKVEESLNESTVDADFIDDLTAQVAALTPQKAVNEMV